MDDADLPALIGRAMDWRDADPDPRTRRELDLLIERCTGTGGRGFGPSQNAAQTAAQTAAMDDLAQRFASPLTFGTAGLRGALGAGPNRMNRAVVIRAAAGLAAFLLDRIEHSASGDSETYGPAPAPPVVVVGYDARHDSDVFARDTCAVLMAAGCRALLLPARLPTPVLAFAVQHLRADAGVMVTASHNPPTDNGYKVYLGGRVDQSAGQGAQLVSPNDAQIAAQIATAPAAIEVAMAVTGWELVPESVVDDYLAAVLRVLDPSGPRGLDVVITPLHGVGGQTAVRAFSLAGFPVPHLVSEQAEPDPDFPTVSFPNPEEAGALDLALASARARGADIVIANDPDADRCAVAVQDQHGRGWRMLRGDEVGALLGEYLLSRPAPAGQPGQPGRPGQRTVANSIVSSQLLRRIAQAHGAHYVQTLTGFKWLARVPDLDYAYEEALGYCVAPGSVRDKDGISAALLVAELAATLKAEGRTLRDALDDLARAHGLHATDQLSIRVDDLAQIDVMIQRLISHPPVELGGHRVVSAENLSDGIDGLPPTAGLRYTTSGGARVIVRPSGTEPKLKCYLEVVTPVGGGTDLGMQHAQATAAQALARLRDSLTTALSPTTSTPISG